MGAVGIACKWADVGILMWAQCPAYVTSVAFQFSTIQERISRSLKHDLRRRQEVNRVDYGYGNDVFLAAEIKRADTIDNLLCQDGRIHVG